jgi:hypothetical protein
MTTNNLSKIGEALYGPRWQTYLAQDLGITDRQMRRWVSGETPTPGDLHERLKTLVRARIKILRGLQ